MKLGSAYSNPNNRNDNGRGTVYDINGIISTIVSMGGGGNKPMIITKDKCKQLQSDTNEMNMQRKSDHFMKKDYTKNV